MMMSRRISPGVWKRWSDEAGNEPWGLDSGVESPRNASGGTMMCIA